MIFELNFKFLHKFFWYIGFLFFVIPTFKKDNLNYGIIVTLIIIKKNILIKINKKNIETLKMQFI